MSAGLDLLLAGAGIAAVLEHLKPKKPKGK